VRHLDLHYFPTRRSSDLLTGRKEPAKLKTLAAAYAEAARFPEAITTAQNAKELASGAGRSELASECQLMLDNFKVGKPWRQSERSEEHTSELQSLAYLVC